MEQIRIHGRGGQGAVTAAYILALAAFEEKKWCQAFPHFGVERRGAPVQSYVRIDDKPVRLRTQIYEPDYVIVLDATLTETVPVAEGAKKAIIMNSTKKPSQFKFKIPVHTADVTHPAIEIFNRDITNTGTLAAFAAFTDLVKLKSLEKGIKQRFSGETAKKNIKLIRQVYKNAKK